MSKFLSILLGKGDGTLLKNVKDTVDEFVYSKEEKAENEQKLLVLSEEAEERRAILDKEAYNKSLDSYLELTKLEVEDRKSARETEIGVLNAPNANFLNVNIRPILALITVIIGLVFFFAIVYKKKEISAINENILYTILGGVIGHLGTIYNYYFGSSVGSDMKTHLLEAKRKKQ